MKIKHSLANSNYSVSLGLLMLCFLLVISPFNSLIGQDEGMSPFIHVDQFGYLPSASKVAVISNPEVGFNSDLSNNSDFSFIEIREANTDTIAFGISAEPWNGGAVHEDSGDSGWWVDFSMLDKEGEYYVYDPQNDTRSAVFEISETVYSDVLKHTGRMFFYNRCNSVKAAEYTGSGWADELDFMNELQDGNCHYIYDQENSNLSKDLSGGWYDAGDYNKYVTFAAGAVHNLLWAYRENPDAFTDNWNIPESGNGIPDLLDEIKWELDWLLKMNNEDGSTHIKMGSKDYSENSSSPPSANADPRYYGPTCSSASIAAAGVFAHAATVFTSLDNEQFNDFIADLSSSAIQSWDYVLPMLNSGELETECDDGSIISGDADWNVIVQSEQAVGSAIYLFELTEDPIYDGYIGANLYDTEQLYDSYWSAYKQSNNDALILYTTLPGSNSSASWFINNSLADASTNNWDDVFGFSEADLYRGHIPTWAYHWGSNLPKAGFGLLNKLQERSDIISVAEEILAQKAEELLHYFHGVNPLSLVYLSNMYVAGGDKCVNEIYHTWFHDGTEWDNALNSSIGPPPGYLSGGANKDFSVGSLSPPSGQPAMKSYLDFNDNFPNNSWEISEPAIYYQATYLRLLANYTNPKIEPAVGISSLDEIKEGLLSAYPNPVENNFTFVLSESGYSRYKILNSAGAELMNGYLNSTEKSHKISLEKLHSGIYFLEIHSPKLDLKPNPILRRKFVKQ